MDGKARELTFSERRSMWIPFELGQTVYIVVDNGYNTEHTIHDGYDHLGEIVRRETVHHPLLEVEPRRFNLQMLAYHGLDGIYATREISIHKALASLDSKIIQTCSTSPLTFYALCSSLPSSTNSVHSPSPLSQPFPLFFRCESPRHFMSAWHSHLV